MASDDPIDSSPQKSDSDQSGPVQTSAQLSAGNARELRVDAAHAVRRADTSTQASDLVAVVSEQQHHALASAEETLGQLIDANASPEVLARQAVDLAQSLQDQLAELDRRTERVNSQEADFESRIRNARLWIDERENELEGREETVRDREAELTEQAGVPLAAFDAERQSERSQDLGERELKLVKQQAELEFSQAQVEEKLSELEIQSALCQTKQEDHDSSKGNWEERQRELDQREAEIYKSIERNACEEVSLADRMANIQATNKQLSLRQDELGEWEQRLGEQASEAEFQRAELERNLLRQQQQQLDSDQQERQLRFREQEIKTALERFQRLDITEQKLVGLEERALEFDMRDNYLANAESLLAEQQMLLSQQQRELQQQELAFENRVTSERRTLIQENEQAALTRRQREQQLERREAELQQRQAALQQLQEELRATQREVLEMRLATEETWLQLQGALAPASLSRSISQVRARLADHFQLSTDDLQNRRQDLENVRQELSEQNIQFQEQRSGLQHWLERREKDIEERAARLVSRETELDAQQREFDKATLRWQSEQSVLQQQIQVLLAQQREEAKHGEQAAA